MMLYGLMDRYTGPPLPASVLGYYYGTGFIDHGRYGNDATEIGTVNQPSSPTPPLGSNWLIYEPATVNDSISIPTTAYSTNQGVIEFYARVNSGGSVFAWLLNITNDFSNRVWFYYYHPSSVLSIVQYVSGGAPVNFENYSFTLDVSHKIRLEYDAAQTSLYIDDVLFATQGPWTDITYNNIVIGNDGIGGAGSALSYGVNNLMFSNDPNEAYPPV